jgi:hypothetical protein
VPLFLLEGRSSANVHCVAEDSTAAAGKGRLLLISAGTVKTPLLPLLEVIKPCCCY